MLPSDGLRQNIGVFAKSAEAITPRFLTRSYWRQHAVDAYVLLTLHWRSCRSRFHTALTFWRWHGDSETLQWFLGEYYCVDDGIIHRNMGRCRHGFTINLLSSASAVGVTTWYDLHTGYVEKKLLPMDSATKIVRIIGVFHHLIAAIFDYSKLMALTLQNGCILRRRGRKLCNLDHGTILISWV